MNFTKHFNSIRILTALAFCFVVGASTLGAQVMCGDIITKPTKLTADLTCVGDAGPAALTVMGRGGKLNLNGFTVDCNNDGDATDTDGILLTGRKARVHSGTVTDCTNGVVFDGTGDHQVSGVTAVSNGENGFFLTRDSDGNKVVDNTAESNSGSGLSVSVSDDNHFVANFADQNGLQGIRIFSGSGNLMTGNTFEQDGIFVDRAGPQKIHGNTLNGGGINLSRGAGGNVVTTNTLVGNGGGNGIDANFPDDNRIEGNIVTNFSNGIVVRVGSTDNRIEGNDATGNTTDLRDNNANCDNNKWKGNIFNTSNVGCIN